MFKTLRRFSLIPFAAGALGFGAPSVNAAIYFTDSNQLVNSSSFETSGLLLISVLLAIVMTLMWGAWLIQPRWFDGQRGRKGAPRGQAQPSCSVGPSTQRLFSSDYTTTESSSSPEQTGPFEEKSAATLKAR